MMSVPTWPGITTATPDLGRVDAQIFDERLGESSNSEFGCAVSDLRHARTGVVTFIFGSGWSKKVPSCVEDDTDTRHAPTGWAGGLPAVYELDRR
jgi:hypothetical protein